MSTGPIPKTMQALLTQADKTVAVKDIPVPAIDDEEILVRTSVVALNPTDWKHVDEITNVGTICGCDWSGHVVQVGKSVTTLAVGDHVAGFAHGGTYEDRGAFAEFLKTPAELAWKVPEGKITDEGAATMGCAFWTAVQALFHPTRLGLIEPPAKVSGDEWVFIYGGSSASPPLTYGLLVPSLITEPSTLASVGMFALQLARAAGYRVVTVASPKNFDLCKSLGADYVFDYKDAEVIPKIKEVTNNSLRYGLDTISLLPSQILSIKSFGDGPGKLVAILQPQQEAQKIREDVPIQFTVVYTTLGRAYFYGPFPIPASLDDKAHMVQFLKKVPDFVASGTIKPNPIRLMGGGLESVHEGLRLLQDGKISGEKLIHRIY